MPTSRSDFQDGARASLGRLSAVSMGFEDFGASAVEDVAADIGLLKLIVIEEALTSLRRLSLTTWGLQARGRS